MIRMKHPLHGFHHASGNEEAEMRKNGWVTDELPVAQDMIKQPVEQPAPDRPTLIAAATELGIKVDQRWSNDRLAAEIEKA